MKTHIILSGLSLALATTAYAANSPAKQPAKPVVLGTTQLDGQNARLGQTFTVGKQQPINITLLSAAYSTSRVMLGTQMVVPKPNEKLLVLRFTAHNPTKSDTSLYGLRFTAVDAKDVNHVSESAFVRAGTSEEFRASLKPAQKVEVVSVVRVPASGVVPKLIAQRGRAPWCAMTCAVRSRESLHHLLIPKTPAARRRWWMRRASWAPCTPWGSTT
ncbi:hypothetical protein ACFSC4_27090 [Deinococcus malanensis]|uniref:hypothetical protein n=1 Tax=Deinococcus malanensis TaxID=1706855 RepID=UPI00362D3AFB